MSELLAFEACQQLNCVELNIVNDLTIEMTESFGVILERTEDMSPVITLNPSDAIIEIIDDDCEYLEQIFYVMLHPYYNNEHVISLYRSHSNVCNGCVHCS